MKPVSISRRLKIGLGSLAAVIVVLAISAVGSATYLATAFSEYRAYTNATESANAIAEDVFEAKLAVDAFRRTQDETWLTEVDENLEEVTSEIDVLFESPVVNEEVMRDLQELLQIRDAYAASFELVTTLDSEMNGLEESFFQTGVSAREQVTALMDSANRAGDAGQTFSAARVQQSLLLGRVYMTRFVLIGTADAHQSSLGHFQEARQQLSWMATMAGDRERAEMMSSATDLLDELLGTSDRIGEVMQDRAALLARMEEQRASMMERAEAITNGMTAQQTAKGATMDRTFLATSLVLAGAAIAALLYALATMKITSKRVSDEFDITLKSVSELAEGNLDIEIEGTEHDTELGRIARALEVFRTRSREAAELSAQSEAARVRAAQEEKRREAEALEAERRQQEAQRLAADQRKKEIFEALRKAVSGVVASAAAGDFSKRVDPARLDPELKSLADEINRLMANVERGLTEIANVSARLAEGDLRTGMAGAFEGTFKELQENIDTMIGSLGGLLAGIMAETEAVAGQSGDMTRSAEDLSRRAESQAASLEQTSASMTQIASSAESNATAAAETDRAAAAMDDEAGRAKDVLQLTVSAMRDIEEGSKEIEAIVDVIEDIAFQTNLLSLNASVEAARAGEAGKGFAVVANEVRALAQRSAEASSKVQSIISQSTGAISRGSNAVEQTGEALEQIVQRISVVSGNLREIKSASEEQATAVKDISNAFAQLDKITQRNAAVAEETRGTAGLLAAQSQRMQAAVGKVRLRDPAVSRATTDARTPARPAA